jgi:ribosomal protein S18 acetylase RimI-like enzyme
MDPVHLRRATPTDAAPLAALGQRTFTHTFGHTYRPEDLAAFLAQSYSVAWHTALLADPARDTWVATAAGALVGFGIAGPCKLPVTPLEAAAGEIQRLYLRDDWQGRGLGTRLLERLLADLAARGHEPLYVGVWAENTGAQRLYARHGFSKVGEYFFPVGAHRDHEFILRR